MYFKFFKPQNWRKRSAEARGRNCAVLPKIYLKGICVMPPALSYILSAVAGYLLGSISISILLSRHLFHQDIRGEGSGNAGATNVARVFGLRAGALTFLGDFLKTVLSLWLGNLLGGTVGMCIAVAAALIGHCFPVYYGFRGGKAVSAGAAAALAIDWRVFVIALAVFAVAALLSRTASVSSMSAALAVGISSIFLAPTAAQRILGIFTGVLVIVMHRSNIRRLLAGTEPKFHPGQRPPRAK